MVADLMQWKDMSKEDKEKMFKSMEKSIPTGRVAKRKSFLVLRFRGMMLTNRS